MYLHTTNITMSNLYGVYLLEHNFSGPPHT